jgi:hypothetical protein
MLDALMGSVLRVLLKLPGGKNGNGAAVCMWGTMGVDALNRRLVERWFVFTVAC